MNNQFFIYFSCSGLGTTNRITAGRNRKLSDITTKLEAKRELHSGQTQKPTSVPVLQSLEVELVQTFTSAKFV